MVFKVPLRSMILNFVHMRGNHYPGTSRNYKRGVHHLSYLQAQLRCQIISPPPPKMPHCRKTEIQVNPGCLEWHLTKIGEINVFEIALSTPACFP